MQKNWEFPEILSPGRKLRNWAKKSLIGIAAGACIILGCTYLVLASISPPLPTPANPIHFYSNQTQQDIKLTFYSAFKKAHTSIHIDMYGITDHDIIHILHQQALKFIPIYIHYDKTGSSSRLLKTLPSSVQLQPAQTKGLMHKKIIMIDDTLVFLGSANLTRASLRHHDNLVIGLYAPHLAPFIRNPSSQSCYFSIGDTQIALWLLPDIKDRALNQLIQHLQSAKKSIRIAMFTFTHPLLTQTLIELSQKGIQIDLAVDHYTAKGASKKSIEQLQRAGINVLLNNGQHLLHHKWAWIDEKTLIMGSANWTLAAFKKNDDFLLFCHHLSAHQRAFLNKLWKHIVVEAFSIEKNSPPQLK